MLKRTVGLARETRVIHFRMLLQAKTSQGSGVELISIQLLSLSVSDAASSGEPTIISFSRARVSATYSTRSSSASCSFFIWSCIALRGRVLTLTIPSLARKPKPDSESSSRLPLRSASLNFRAVSAIKHTGYSSPFDLWMLSTLTPLMLPRSRFEAASRLLPFSIMRSMYATKSDSVL